jgi:branched-chain amino acid transport system substrate-binding protein
LPRLAAPLLVVVACLAAGCGAAGDIARGGKVSGEALTIYSMLPRPGTGASADIVDGEKLALLEAGGVSGAYKVNFVSVEEAPGPADATDAGAAAAAREAIADPQVAAVIGAAGNEAAMVAVPLYDAAGILHVSPGAGYPGFTEPVAPGEPERWHPSGRRTFARLVADDRAQATALLAAARAAASTLGGASRGGARPLRFAVEQEPGAAADAIVAALRDAMDEGGAALVDDPARADAVIYAGEDPENAAGVAEGLAREAPRAAVVLPDAVTRGGVAGRLAPAARRRAVLVSAAPEPGSTPALREFEARLREALGREPGPYAALGYEAMRSVLDAIARAGKRAGRRQAVIDAYLVPGRRTGTLLGDYAIEPDGERDTPALRAFTAFRLRGGEPEYLDLRPAG